MRLPLPGTSLPADTATPATIPPGPLAAPATDKVRHVG